MISLVFIIFVLVLPLSLFSGVVCTQQPNGSWICSGDGGVSGGGSVVTNVVGVCTNCIAVTPSECERFKIELNYNIDVLQDGYDMASGAISEARDILNGILSEGDEFFLDSSLNGAISSSQYTDYPQSQFFTPNNTQTAAAQRYGAVNGIANYFDSLRPQLESMDYKLQSASDSVENIGGSVYALRDLSSQIDCSSCTASFDGDPVITNSPPSSGSGCPCDEQINALNKLVKDDILPRIKSIDDNVKLLTNIVTIAREQFQVVKEGMHNITNLLVRLDDYVLDDFSNRVVQIRYDVNFIASNLAQRVKQIDPYISTNYWNAVHYLDNDNQRFSMADMKEVLVDDDNTEGKRFDFGEFEKLPWFSRIEFLLTDIAGYYDKTNNVSEVEEVERKIKDLERSSSSDSSSISNTIATLGSNNFSAISDSLSRLWDNFSFFGSGSSTIEGVEVISGDVSGFFGQDISSIHIKPFEGMNESIADYDWIIEVCRYAFQAFYLAGFSFVLFKLVAFLYLQVGKVITMLLRLYSAIFGT